MDIKEEIKNNSKRFNKIVIWGLKNRWHTHRFVFAAYYRILKKSGVRVVWVEDEKKNQAVIEPNDLIIMASGAYGKMVPQKHSLADYNVPIRDDIYYCLHAEQDFFIEKIKPERRIILNVYSDELRSSQYPEIYEGVHFDAKTRTLHEPWGTDLLPEEFKKPTFNRHKFVFWVGSIWNDAGNHGNLEEIAKLKAALEKRKIKFLPVRFVPNFMNILLVRLSRIAPAIGGRYQVEINYLPDRMFKNISYGQLGFSNIKKFNDISKDCSVYDENIDTMVEKALTLTKEQYLDLVKKQQEICKRYTIAENLNNFLKYI
jgi:hypothetical protein